MSTFIATCPMCGEGVQPPAGTSSVATCPNCGEVIPLPKGWGRRRTTVAAASWRTVRRGVGHVAIGSGIAAGALIGLAGLWLVPIRIEEFRFESAAILWGSAAVLAYLTHTLWSINGLESAADGAAAFGCERRAVAAAWLLKVELIAAWCTPIAALFATVPPANTAAIAWTILRGLLMGAALTYGLAYPAACLFLSDVARHIGNRRLPSMAALHAAAVVILGVAGAVIIYWGTEPVDGAASADSRAITVSIAKLGVLGLAVHHLLFVLLCRRVNRLIDTEIEFELAPGAARPAASATSERTH